MMNREQREIETVISQLRIATLDEKGVEWLTRADARAVELAAPIIAEAERSRDSTLSDDEQAFSVVASGIAALRATQALARD